MFCDSTFSIKKNSINLCCLYDKNDKNEMKPPVIDFSI